VPDLQGIRIDRPQGRRVLRQRTRSPSLAVSRLRSRVGHHAPRSRLRWLCTSSFYYNFVRIRQTLTMSPAMAAGHPKRLWEMKDVVNMIKAFESRKLAT
jgi:hypothetical protein